MDTFLNIFEIFITFFEGLILLLFLNAILTSKMEKAKFPLFILSAIVYTILITICNSFSLVSTLGIVSMTFILAAEITIIDKCEIISAITSAIVIVAIQGMIEMFVICCVSIIANDPDFIFKIISSSNLARIVFIISIKLIILTLYLISKNYLFHLSSDIVKDKIFIITAVIGYILNIRVSALLNTNQTTELRLGLSLMFIGFISAIVLIVCIIQKLTAKKALERENYFTGLKNNLLEQNLKNLNLLYEEKSKKLHDFNHHINAINIMAENNQIDRLKEYISEISTQPKYKCEPFTKNEIINIITNIKSEEIRRKNIYFEVNINIGKKIGINDSDICSILVNLIDNAIEAAEKADKKEINLFIEERGNLIYISIENTCTANPILTGFASSKDGSHGWGTKIIADIVQKYNGAIDYDFKENILKFNVILVKNSHKNTT